MSFAVLLVPLIPGAIWLWIFYRTDRYEPEPKRLVLGTFVLGALAIAPAMLGERLGQQLLPFTLRPDAFYISPREALAIFLGCFLVIGPCEELSKFAAVRLFIYRNAQFNEPLDGMIYAAAAALGFASLENVFYVIEFSPRGLSIHWSALLVRSFLALFGHVSFATTWGFALGRQKFNARHRVWTMVLLASALHGLYDFLLFYPPTRHLVFIYISVMAVVVWRQIRILPVDSPFAPGAFAPAQAGKPEPTADAVPPEDGGPRELKPQSGREGDGGPDAGAT